MQIISSRRLLFEKTRYADEVIDDKPTSRKVHSVLESIIVSADTRPQIVPEWIKDEELYQICVDDRVLIEVTVSNKPVLPTTSLKAIKTENEIPVAKFADDVVEQTNDVEKTGWVTKV